MRIAERYAIPHISTGDMLRSAVRAGSKLGDQVAATLASGGLVSDTLMTDVVRERLAQPDVASGFILDGFPRTVAQAIALDEMASAAPVLVVLIAVAHEEIVRRLSKRRVCNSCGITQSVSDVQARHDVQIDPCPYCGGSLVRRQDDHPDTVTRRLATYAAYAEPVADYYRPKPVFGSVNGLGDPDAVTVALCAQIDARRIGG
jgi:adenylate kinase